MLIINMEKCLYKGDDCRYCSFSKHSLNIYCLVVQNVSARFKIEFAKRFQKRLNGSLIWIENESDIYFKSMISRHVFQTLIWERRLDSVDHGITESNENEFTENRGGKLGRIGNVTGPKIETIPWS